MNNRVNLLLDIILKSLSLLFTICMLVGAAVTWSYLSKAGLGNEVSSLISSPQVLLLIAIYSLAVSVSVLSIVLIVPAVIDFCENSDEMRWANRDNLKNRFVFRFLLVFIPLCLFMLFSLIGVNSFLFLFIYFVIVFVMTYIFYQVHGGPEALSRDNSIRFFVTVFLSLIVTYGMLLNSLLLFFRVTIYIEDNEVFQWVILCVFFIVYCAVVALANRSSSYFSYIPVAFLSFIVIVFVFSDSASANVVAKLRVGGYATSYAVDKKYIAAVVADKSYTIEKLEDKDVLILRDVWVVAILSNKVIISANKNSKKSYSMPLVAILGELNESDKLIQ